MTILHRLLLLLLLLLLVLVLVLLLLQQQQFELLLAAWQQGIHLCRHQVDSSRRRFAAGCGHLRDAVQELQQLC